MGRRVTNREAGTGGPGGGDGHIIKQGAETFTQRAVLRISDGLLVVDDNVNGETVLSADLELAGVVLVTDIGDTVPPLIAGQVPQEYLPPFVIFAVVDDEAELLALDAEVGHMVVRTDTEQTLVLAADPPSVLANWQDMFLGSGVTAVNTRSGNVTLVATDIPIDADDFSGLLDNTITDPQLLAEAVDAIVLPTTAAPSGAAGGQLSGTYPNPSVATSHAGSTHADVQLAAETTAASELALHVAEISAAHVATAIEVESSGFTGLLTGTADAQAAFTTIDTIDAGQIPVEAGGFDQNLDATVVTVQLLAERVNTLTITSLVESVNELTGVVVLTAANVNAINIDQLGVASGVATLDGTGRLNLAEWPVGLVTSVNSHAGSTVILVGADIDIDADDFSGNLDGSVVDVQLLANAVDALDTGGGTGGHTVKTNGTPLTARTGLNFSSLFTVTDDAGGNETDVTLHTDVALLAGRSGGQILKGGTGSGDDLTLQSTNHATRGDLLFLDRALFGTTVQPPLAEHDGALDATTPLNVASMFITKSETITTTPDHIGEGTLLNIHYDQVLDYDEPNTLDPPFDSIHFGPNYAVGYKPDEWDLGSPPGSQAFPRAIVTLSGKTTFAEPAGLLAGGVGVIDIRVSKNPTGVASDLTNFNSFLNNHVFMADGATVGWYFDGVGSNYIANYDMYGALGFGDQPIFTTSATNGGTMTSSGVTSFLAAPLIAENVHMHQRWSLYVDDSNGGWQGIVNGTGTIDRNVAIQINPMVTATDNVVFNYGDPDITGTHMFRITEDGSVSTAVITGIGNILSLGSSDSTSASGGVIFLNAGTVNLGPFFDLTHTSGNYTMMAFPYQVTMDASGGGGATGNAFTAIGLTGDVIFDQAGNAFGSTTFTDALTYTNTTSSALSLGHLYSAFLSPTLTAADATVTGSYEGVVVVPTLNETGAGTLNLTDLFGFRVGFGVPTGTSAVNVKGLVFSDPTGAGAITALTAIDLGTLTRGTTNITLLSAGTAASMRHVGPGVFGTVSAPTNASVGLEVQSTTRSLLLPRMTATQRDALTAVDGMLVYDTTTGRLHQHRHGIWRGTQSLADTYLGDEHAMFNMFEDYEIFATTVTASGNLTGISRGISVATISGTGAQITQSGNSDFAPGVARLESGSQAAGRVGLNLGTGSGLMLFVATGRYEMQARVQVPTVSDGTNTFEVRIGFSSAWNTATPNDFIGFVGASGANWVCTVTDDTTPSTVNSGIAINTSFLTFYIIWDSVLAENRFYIQQSGVMTLVGTIAGSTRKPDDNTSLSPGVGIFKSVGTTSRFVGVDYLGMKYEMRATLAGPHL